MIAVLPSHQRRPSRPAGTDLRVSAFEAVTSLLLAIVWMLVALVAVLSLLWCLDAATTEQTPRTASRTTWNSSGGLATLAEFEQPSEAEIEHWQAPDPAGMLAQLEPAIMKIAATMNGEDAAGRERFGGGIQGSDSRGGDGTDIVPRHERWVLLFTARDRADYAEQLDAHRIELGVFGGGVSGLDYACELSTRLVTRRQNDPEKEQRLYFSWALPTPLAAFESELLENAGVTTAGRQVVKLIPTDLEHQLAVLELQHAKENDIDSIQQVARTVFENRPDSDGDRFVVIKQRYRKPIADPTHP